jgi:UDP-N-acetylmuramoyl-tripeptide--D-alanyl-D-alanine ligase
MNHAGEIRTLVAIAEPDVRVWTNVGDAHLGFFGSADDIADAKSEILEHADGRTVLVCNADDARIAARIGAFPGRLVTFGASDGASVQALEIADRGLDGMSARVRTPAGECPIEVPLPGRGNLFNALAAIAVSAEFGLRPDEIAGVLATLRPADRRGVVRRLRGGVRLLDDSYNSSPSALGQSLEILAHERSAGRRVAVLGEMLELGAHATMLHERCGRAAAAAGVGRLFVIGGEPARAMGRAAVAAGLSDEAVTWFETSAAAAPVVAAALAPGDVVLVKGSRGTRTDIVADRVVAELG